MMLQPRASVFEGFLVIGTVGVMFSELQSWFIASFPKRCQNNALTLTIAGGCWCCQVFSDLVKNAFHQTV